MVNSPEEMVKRWLMDEKNEIDDQLDSFLEELNSPEIPPLIKPSWIRTRLSHMSKYDLRDWVREGFIPAELLHRGELPHKKKIHSLFSHDGAILAGHIWYFREKGSPLAEAVAKANKFLKDE